MDPRTGGHPLVHNPYQTVPRGFDTTMADATAAYVHNEAPPVLHGVRGDRALVYQRLNLFHDDVMIAGINEFHRSVCKKDESLCIKKAFGKPDAERSAEAIAAVVEGERRQEPAILRGVVRTEVRKLQADHEKELARLKAEVQKLSLGAKPGKVGKKKKSNKPGQQNFPQKSRTAQQNPAPNKKRGGTPGPGAGSSKGKEGSRKNASKSKSAGKRGASSNGKRS